MDFEVRIIPPRVCLRNCICVIHNYQAGKRFQWKRNIKVVCKTEAKVDCETLSNGHESRKVIILWQTT